MSSHHTKVFFASLLVIQLLNAVSAFNGANCSCSDSAQSFIVLYYSKDYGYSGLENEVNFKLDPPLQPGAVVRIFTKPAGAGRRRQTSFKNENGDYLLHVDARNVWDGKYELFLTSYINGAWRGDYRQLINPVATDAKLNTTIIYEANGYRIFINSREMAFYEHRQLKKPTILNLLHDVVYEIEYITTLNI